jgi:U3 small nucleolar RNA-associated protein 7
VQATPFETKKQMREAEVHAVLEKIPADMISIDPDFVAHVDRTPKEVIAEVRHCHLLVASGCTSHCL